MFSYQNRPFNSPYHNHQQSFLKSPNGLYRPTMDSSLSSESNHQTYSPVNHINLDMDFDDQLFHNLDFYVRTVSGQAYYPTHYSTGQGSGYGSFHDSAPADDDSPVEEMSPIKAKKPSKRASKAKKKYARMWIRSRRRYGQLRKRSHCAELGVMCQKIARCATL